MRKPEELDILKRLEKLQAVAKTFQREKPFLIRVPLSPWPEVSEEELRLLMRPFWLAHPRMPVFIEPVVGKPDLPLEGMHLLALIARMPGLTSTEFYREIGVPMANGSRLKKILTNLGLIKIHEIQTGRRGGKPEALQLLPAGYERIGMNAPQQPVKGSYSHRFWAWRIKRWLEKNHG